jgi:plasmid maintenance system antidote protein VapI
MVTHKVMAEILGVSENVISIYITKGYKWHCAKGPRGMIDEKKVMEVEVYLQNKKDTLDEFGSMLFFYLQDVIGIKKVNIAKSLGLPESKINISLHNNNFYKKLIDEYNEHIEDFRCSDYNYLSSLEKYEEMLTKHSPCGEQ